jgi:hypothetical protein
MSATIPWSESGRGASSTRTSATAAPRAEPKRPAGARDSGTFAVERVGHHCWCVTKKDGVAGGFFISESAARWFARREGLGERDAELTETEPARCTCGEEELRHG